MRRSNGSGEEIVPRAVLVTVGTGGLGAAVTNRFLEDGHSVVPASTFRGTSETATGSLSHFGEQFHLLQEKTLRRVGLGRRTRRANG